METQKYIFASGDYDKYEAAKEFAADKFLVYFATDRKQFIADGINYSTVESITEELFNELTDAQKYGRTILVSNADKKALGLYINEEYILFECDKYATKEDLIEDEYVIAKHFDKMDTAITELQTIISEGDFQGIVEKVAEMYPLYTKKEELITSEEVIADEFRRVWDLLKQIKKILDI